MLGALLVESKTTADGCWLYWLGPRLDGGTAPPVWYSPEKRRRNLRVVLWEYLGREVKAGHSVVTTCHRRMCWRPSPLVVKRGAECRDWFDAEVAPAGLLLCSTCDGPLAEHRVGQCVPLSGPSKPDPTTIARKVHV